MVEKLAAVLQAFCYVWPVCQEVYVVMRCRGVTGSQLSLVGLSRNVPRARLWPVCSPVTSELVVFVKVVACI